MTGAERAFGPLDEPLRLDKCIMKVRLEPEELSRRLGGKPFDSGRDDLGRYRHALVRDDRSGLQLWLLRHEDCPDPGTEVYVEADEHRLGELKQVLGLRGSEVSWVHPKERSRTLPGSSDLARKPGARAGGTIVLWAVWRQDDNGTRTLIATFARRADAEARAAELEAAGHRQTYWVSRSSASPPV